ncbi:putative olfactory receptor 3A4 [Galemys pyrenaicus]|uniref:Olfactory receptor n=1 Tax=Galemys pyrenaicus TaxID=202257 RepID=A0A8J6AH00_GALPY|nr:putative olfactory receptor 3A4 [Galemys pyrenaicus]
MDLGVPQNDSVVTDFILLGLAETPTLKSILFVIFLLAYIATVGGNFSILAAIITEPKLHTPMYFFLGNLSVLDVGCITVTVPAMLRRFMSNNRSVPYGACLSQLFFFHLLAGVDCFLLTVMAYDRYLAICQPLTYSTRMSWGIQRALAVMSCVFSFTNALTQTVALFQLSCSSTQLNEKLLFAAAAFMGVAPLVLISVSYAHVVAAVLRIRSAEGRKKAFSTCGSHLTVVGIFYGTGVFSYMRLGSVEASDKDKGIGILNTIVSPLLNPLIYSLRNPDVQGALQRVFMGRQPPK